MPYAHRNYSPSAIIYAGQIIVWRTNAAIIAGFVFVYVLFLIF